MPTTNLTVPISLPQLLRPATPDKIGEVFIARSLTLLHKIGGLGGVRCFSPAVAGTTTLDQYLAQPGIQATGIYRPSICPLQFQISTGPCLFNTEHNIDVLIEGAAECLPVEVKLGLTDTPGRLRDQYEGTVGYDPSNRQLTGSMISILEGRFNLQALQSIAEEAYLPPARPLRVAAQDGSTNPLRSEWLLVLRRPIWNRKRSTFLSLKRVRVVLFEEIARAVANTLGGDAAFDRFVRRCFGSGYRQAWGI